MTSIGIVKMTLLKNKWRTALLMFTVAIAFLIYGVLGTLRFSMLGGTDEAAETRLIITHQAGITQALPMSFAQRLSEDENVELVGHATWLGAYYQTTKQMLMAFAVDSPVWLDQHPDMILTDEHREAFLSTRNGLLVSEPLAEKFGWRVGDDLPLRSVMYQPTNGDSFWRFKIAGVFRSGAESGGRNYSLMHYDYLNEGRPYLKDTVGTFMVTARDPGTIDALAMRIDERFANSSHPITAATDRAFHTSFFKQFGDLFFMIKAITLISFVSLVLVVGSTLTLSIRQRTKDIGILKSIGFSHARILALVLMESFIIVCVGSLIGLGLAAATNILFGLLLPQFLPSMSLPMNIPIETLLIVLGLSIITSLVPGLLALRMRPVEALSH